MARLTRSTLLIATAAIAARAQVIISTIAGNGQQGASGNGGAATSAALYWPYAAVPLRASGGAAPMGALLVVDTYNSEVRAVNAGEHAAVLAARHHIPASAGRAAARRRGPRRLWDVTATLRRVVLRCPSRAGTITLFAGTGTVGFSGDGAQATAAQLNQPQGVCFSATGASLARKGDRREVATWPGRRGSSWRGSNICDLPTVTRHTCGVGWCVKPA